MNQNTNTSVIKDINKKLKEEFDALHEEIMRFEKDGRVYMHTGLIETQISLAAQIIKGENILDWRSFPTVHPEDEYEEQVESESCKGVENGK